MITPISPEDEKLRLAAGGRGPQNYMAPLSAYTLRDWMRRLRRGTRKERYFNHIPAGEIRSFVGRRIWDAYFKFCFERNPWDRLISLYYWRFQTEPRPTIAEFLATDIPLMLRRRGRDLYTIDGEVAVDRICRFEALSEELEEIRIRLGMPEAMELPRAKAGTRVDRSSHHEIPGEAERRKISELFREEIELLGYRFQAE